MKLQFEFKKGALAFCLFFLSIFLVYGVYASSYEEVSKSTATIVHENGLGSGFFIDKNLLVTNYHVVEDAEDGVVSLKTQGGIEDAGKVVVTDEESDLAIIRTLRSDYTALEMGSDVGLKMGDEIFVIGSPEGLGGTLSQGIISAQRRGDRLQITAPISSGSSGSPVFSKDFKIIGISVSYMPEGQNLNFAIPVSKLRELIRKNKVALERVEIEEAIRQSESNFGKELASYENKKDKTPQEMYYVGFAYYSEGNYQEAIHWFEKATAQGDADAQFMLGFMYNNGEGVTKDHQKALYWYKKSADQGYALAQYNLGWMYDREKGIARDYPKAVYWYEKATTQGYAAAQYNLAVMYYNGEGITKDYKKAVYWYKKAANQGLAPVQYNLAVMYYNGEGVVQNYKKALYWFEKSADQGDAKAQFMLGSMYHYGTGVTRNYVEAYKWLILAKAQSNEADGKIDKALGLLGIIMTSDQISEAQELASQFEAQSK